MNADGSDQTRLTFSAGSDTEPVGAPDGPIVFSGFRPACDGREIYRMDPTGATRPG